MKKLTVRISRFDPDTDEAVHLEATRTLAAGETVDLTFCIDANAEFFKSGPGYNA